MIKLNGNTEEGQNVMFPVYWVCLGSLILLWLVHIIVICHDNWKQQQKDLSNHNPYSLSKQRSRNMSQAPFQDTCFQEYHFCRCISNITYNHIVHTFSILAIICGIGYIFVGVLPYHHFRHKSCHMDSAAGAIFYSYHKFSIYACLIVRLQSSFAGSSYAYHNRTIVTLHIINIACMVLASTFLDILTIKKDHVATAKNGGYICQILYPFWGSASLALVDLIINIILLALFIQPLLALAKRQHQNMQANQKFAEFTYTGNENSDVENTATATVSHVGSPTAGLSSVHVPPRGSSRMLTKKASVDTESDIPSNKRRTVGGTSVPNSNQNAAKKQQLREFRKTSQFYKLSIKVTVLTFIMVAVTVIALGLYSVWEWTIGLVIDIVINCFCLILMFRSYNRIYRCTFGCCDMCFAACGTCLMTSSLTQDPFERQMAVEVQEFKEEPPGQDETPL